jgi:regulator of protease activity HflC (stomatin/prohibitin superfamily)
MFWRVVNRYEKMIVLRFGNLRGVRSPGLRFVIPFVDRPIKVNLQEQVERVPTQKYITSDNVVVDMDFVIYYRVLPEDDNVTKSVIDIEDFRTATINLSFATLRAVIGATTLAEALSERERIRDQLQVRMDEVTGRWGIKVNQVEINEIDPPGGVRAAMEREKSAAAIKTADITESEGARQAEINRAEGEKQASILKAEGERQAEILQAEGDQQAAVLRADGFSAALDKIHQVAQNIDANTLSLQYFDTLKQLGASESTKFIFPMEFTNMLTPFTRMVNRGGAGDGGSED